MKYLRSCREPNGILAKRKIGNSIQYFVKLPNQTDEQCSWIDQDYLHIDKFIEEFEKTKKIHIDFDLNKRDQIENQMAHRDSIQQQLIDLINSNSFMTKLRVDRVITAVRHHKQVLYLVKWKHSDLCDFVHAEQLRTLYPQALIQFYEKKLKRILEKRKNQSRFKPFRKNKRKRLDNDYYHNDDDDDDDDDDDCVFDGNGDNGESEFDIDSDFESN